MKKILIIYATAGIGHKKAAFAVNKAFGDLKPKDAERESMVTVVLNPQR